MGSVDCRWWPNLPRMALLLGVISMAQPSSNENSPDVYASSVIHEELIKDRARTQAYKTTILNNSALFKGKVVADLGCGVGLMSMLAARAGAKKVYCIDSSKIADTARKLVEMNGYSDTIEVIQAYIEEVDIPTRKIDIIISEWMGYFLFYEDLLPAVLTFRDRYLSPNGVIFPSRARLWSGLYSDTQWEESRIGYWKDVYGFDYSPIVPKLKKEQFSAPERQHLKPDGIISKHMLLADLNLYKTTHNDIEEIASTLSFTFLNNATIHGIAFWFDVDFEGPEVSVRLDTSPSSGYTSFEQIIWYLSTPFHAHTGDTVKGGFSIRRGSTSGDFDVSVHFDKPVGLSLHTYDQGSHNLYQDLYERIEFEHSVYDSLPQLEIKAKGVAYFIYFLGGCLSMGLGFLLGTGCICSRPDR
ncbi:hypothetical protein AAMO2058_000416900 [Amorphochlora amoebiformis]